MTLPTPLRRSQLLALTTSARFTADLHVLGIVTSTNDLALQLAEKGAPDGTVVVADGQTAGRGRQGATWSSAAGAGVYLSVVLRPAPPAPARAMTVIAAGLAAAAAIEQVTGLPARIKWPNDVWVQERKVGGVLIEMRGAAPAFAVIGIGVTTVRTADLGQVAPGLVPPGALADHLPAAPSREALVAAVLDSLDALLEQGSRQPAALVSAFAARDALRGQIVSIEAGSDVWRGRLIEIDPLAGLTLETGPGERRLVRPEHARVVAVELPRAPGAAGA